MSENFQATNLNQNKGQDEFAEVEALIQETLAETKKEEEKNKPKETPAINQQTPEKPAEIKVDKPKEEKIEKEIKPIENKEPTKPVQKEATKPTPTTEAEKYAATFKEYKVGDIVKGTVLKVDQSGVLVDIKYKADGLITPEDLSDRPFNTPNDVVKVGDLIDVCITNLENKEGNIVLSKVRADQEKRWKVAYNAMRQRLVIEGKVIQALKGGLVVDCDGIRGFVPASQVAKKRDQALNSFLGKVIPLKIIEVNRRQGKIVLSHKLGFGEKGKLEAQKIFDELEVGQIRHGKVCSIKNFGAFVDIGGVEGLIHLSELAWKRVKHPTEVVKLGQELDVFVLGVDKVNRKVALGLKELQDDPWVNAAEYYKPGQIVKAKIARFVKFGAFAELDHDLEGLIHISEMCKEHIQHPSEAKYPDGQPIKVGDLVDVKILRVIPEEQKIGLSIKAAISQKEKEEIKQVTSQQEADSKVTIADMIAEKEKARAQEEADLEEEEQEDSSSETNQTPEEPKST